MFQCSSGYTQLVQIETFRSLFVLYYTIFYLVGEILKKVAPFGTTIEHGNLIEAKGQSIPKQYQPTNRTIQSDHQY